jgi:hypothetical protein
MKSTNLLIITSCWTLNEMQIFIFCCVLLWDVHNFVWPRPALISRALFKWSDEPGNAGWVFRVGRCWLFVAVLSALHGRESPCLYRTYNKVHTTNQNAKPERIGIWKIINNNATRKEKSWFTSYMRVESVCYWCYLCIHTGLKSPNDCAQKSYFRNMK